MNMCRALLYSTNIAVIHPIFLLLKILIQVGKTYLHLYPSGLPSVIETLIKHLEQGTPEEEFIILKFLQPLCKTYSHVMQRFLSFFFVRYSDPAFLANVKVDILYLLVSSDTAMGIVKELMVH
jgi:AP-3 complex subunit beta